MAMAEFDLTPTWVEVFDGDEGSCVLQASAPCEISIGAEPTGPTLNLAIRLREKPQGSGYEFSATGLTGISIWAREGSGFSSTKVTVASW